MRECVNYEKVVNLINYCDSNTNWVCGVHKGDDALGNKFTVKSYTQGEGFKADVYVLVDKKSGVNYYWINAGYGKSLCPIYDKEGKVVIDKVEQE